MLKKKVYEKKDRFKEKEMKWLKGLEWKEKREIFRKQISEKCKEGNLVKEKKKCRILEKKYHRSEIIMKMEEKKK